MTKRTAALEDAIIEGISRGTTLAELCRQNGLGVRTVHDWREADEGFSARFARARDIGFDAIAERVRATARGKKGEEGDSSGDVQRDKLIIETDLKLLAKWDPRRYGDLIKLGGDDANPLKISIVRYADDSHPE